MITILKQLLLTGLLLTGTVFFSQSQELNEKLSSLKPFLNKNWEGILSAPDGSGGFRVVRNYEAIWNGRVIKCSKSNPDLKNNGEGYFYWDDVSKKIAFFFIESGGVFNTGFVTLEGNIITIEGKMT